MTQLRFLLALGALTFATQVQAYVVLEDVSLPVATLAQMPLVEPLASFPPEAVCEMDIEHLVEADRSDEETPLLACLAE